MILICIANYLQSCTIVDYKHSLHGLPVDFDEHLCILYEVSLNPLSFFAIKISFFNNDFCLVTKKV